MSHVPVMSQAQYVSFHGSLGLHRQGEKEGVSVRSHSYLPISGREQTTTVVVHGPGQDSAPFLRTEVGEDLSQLGKHFLFNTSLY